MQYDYDWTRISAGYIKKGLSSQQYREAMIYELKKHISFDAYCCTLIDPISLLSIGAVTEYSIEQIHHKIISYEYGYDDFVSYERMIESGVTVSILRLAIKGESDRYTEVLEPAGFSDEARVVLMSNGQCWGFLTLFKKSASHAPYFQESDEQLLAEVAPIMGGALKQYHHYIIDEPIIARGATKGIIVLSDQLEVLSMNDRGKELLGLLQQHERVGVELSSPNQLQPSTPKHVNENTRAMDKSSISELTLPKPVQALALKLLAQMIDESYTLLVPVPLVGYITVSATRLFTTMKQTQLAIYIDSASANEMLAYLMDAYRLTPREQEIIHHLMKGSSSKEIATQLSISSYTVSDHLKSIYTKLEVSSRNEVIWKLFSRFQVDFSNS